MTEINLPGRPPISAEQSIQAPTPEQAGRKSAGGKAKTKRTNGLSGNTVQITLHDSERIPPTGQFFGINGRSFMLKPGVRATVPVELVEVLDNCVMSEPVLDDKLRVIAMRNVPRLTYQLHRESLA